MRPTVPGSPTTRGSEAIRRATGPDYTRPADALPAPPATLGDGARGLHRRPLLGFLDDDRRDACARRRATTPASPRSSPRPRSSRCCSTSRSRRRSCKYGFRYVETERWGRLRRMFEIALAFKLAGGLLAGLALVVLAPFADELWGVGDVLAADAVAARCRSSRRPRASPAAAILLRGRYDVRGALPRRLDGAAAHRRRHRRAVRRRPGRWSAIVRRAGRRDGRRSRSVGLGRVPALPAGRVRSRSATTRPRGAAVRARIDASASALVVGCARRSARPCSPVVAPIAQAGYFRNAQAPATGLRGALARRRGSCCSPSRRATSRRGRHDAMYAMLRRYIAGHVGADGRRRAACSGC